MCTVVSSCYTLCVLVEEPEEEADELSAKTRKPWGDTSFYCPVSLKEQGVLWPGSLDTTIRYRDKLYAFSTDEAKDKFMLHPNIYVASDTPLKVQELTTCTTSNMYSCHVTVM